MKRLGDNDNPILPENFLAADNGVERTQPRIIKCNGCVRNTTTHERLSHFNGLIIKLRPVVTTKDKMIDLAELV